MSFKVNVIRSGLAGVICSSLLAVGCYDGRGSNGFKAFRPTEAQRKAWALKAKRGEQPAGDSTVAGDQNGDETNVTDTGDGGGQNADDLTGPIDSSTDDGAAQTDAGNTEGAENKTIVEGGNVSQEPEEKPAFVAESEESVAAGEDASLTGIVLGADVVVDGGADQLTLRIEALMMIDGKPYNVFVGSDAAGEILNTKTIGVSQVAPVKTLVRDYASGDEVDMSTKLAIKGACADEKCAKVHIRFDLGMTRNPTLQFEVENGKYILTMTNIGELDAYALGKCLYEAKDDTKAQDACRTPAPADQAKAGDQTTADDAATTTDDDKTTGGGGATTTDQTAADPAKDVKADEQAPAETPEGAAALDQTKKATDEAAAAIANGDGVDGVPSVVPDEKDPFEADQAADGVPASLRDQAILNTENARRQALKAADAAAKSKAQSDLIVATETAKREAAQKRYADQQAAEAAAKAKAQSDLIVNTENARRQAAQQKAEADRKEAARQQEIERRKVESQQRLDDAAAADSLLRSQAIENTERLNREAAQKRYAEQQAAAKSKAQSDLIVATETAKRQDAQRRAEEQAKLKAQGQASDTVVGSGGRARAEAAKLKQAAAARDAAIVATEAAKREAAQKRYAEQQAAAAKAKAQSDVLTATEKAKRAALTKKQTSAKVTTVTGSGGRARAEAAKLRKAKAAAAARAAAEINGRKAQKASPYNH